MANREWGAKKETKTKREHSRWSDISCCCCCCYSFHFFLHNEPKFGNQLCLLFFSTSAMKQQRGERVCIISHKKREFMSCTLPVSFAHTYTHILPLFLSLSLSLAPSPIIPSTLHAYTASQPDDAGTVVVVAAAVAVRVCRSDVSKRKKKTERQNKRKKIRIKKKKRRRRRERLETGSERRMSTWGLHTRLFDDGDGGDNGLLGWWG